MSLLNLRRAHNNSNSEYINDDSLSNSETEESGEMFSVSDADQS